MSKITITKSFKELVRSRAASDPAFAEALLREGIDTMLSGDVHTGKSILRDYIKETASGGNLARISLLSLSSGSNRPTLARTLQIAPSSPYEIYRRLVRGTALTPAQSRLKRRFDSGTVYI